MTTTRPSALITGGGTGIGFATAQAFAGEGFNVSIAGRRTDVLDDAAARLRAEYPTISVLAVPTNVADPDAVQALVAETVDTFERIDTVVSNAAILDVTPFQDMSMHTWNTMFESMVGGAAALCIESVKHMRAAGSGRIIIVGSVSGIISDAGLPHYSAAKAALHSLARGLAVDLAPFGIVANAVAPGWVRTPMNADFVDEADADFMRHMNPMSRAAAPEEIAEVIRYLGTDAPLFLSGATICVDGGQTAMNHYH